MYLLIIHCAGNLLLVLNKISTVLSTMPSIKLLNFRNSRHQQCDGVSLLNPEAGPHITNSAMEIVYLTLKLVDTIPIVRWS